MTLILYGASMQVVGPARKVQGVKSVNSVPNPRYCLDMTIAYLLCVECLPRESMWFHAISLRGDGTTPEGIFKVFDAVRCELHARIGDVAEGRAVGTGWSCNHPDVAITDVETAYVLLISSLPRRDYWSDAICSRNDGSSVDGVCSVIDELRASLQAHLGNLRGSATNYSRCSA